MLQVVFSCVPSPLPIFLRIIYTSSPTIPCSFNLSNMSSDLGQHPNQMSPHGGPSLYKAPMKTPCRRLKVVVIGAGMACIEFLYKAYNVYHLGEYVDFTVFEANADVGGTWLVNRYPGVAW